MKTKARFLPVLLTLSCLLTLFAPAVSAESGSGLNSFPDVKTYQNGQFTDVPAGSWYENSVKTVYQKGLMEGVGGGLFEPSQIIPWAQAVTLAARLHAIYNGQEIPDAGGAWYAKYMSYAEKAGILPSTCPEGGEAAGKPITRQELAGLFCNILSAEDLPGINDMSIPDIDRVSPEFVDSAKAMYAAGIFTGKEGNRFDPNGQAQRAEIATIVSRLLLPGTRVGQDSKANQAMADQYGNFANGGWAVMSGGVNYYTLRGFTGTGLDKTETCYIVARTDGGVCTELYSADNISDLSIYNGKLYFLERQDKSSFLKCLDLNTNKAETVYQPASGNYMEAYILYDGEIYVLEESSNTNFGRISDGKLISIASLSKDRTLYTANTLHIFNGKAYYVYGTGEDTSSYDYAVCSLDLKSGKTEQVTEKICNGLAAFNDAACWYVTYSGDRDGTVMQLKRFNLLLPDIVETFIDKLPRDFGESYWHMFANGGSLYYQVSSRGRLWSISDSGKITEAAVMPSPYYERSTVTNQGIILHALEYNSVLNPDQVYVILPDGRRITYPDFLGEPTMYEGTSLYELTDVKESGNEFEEGTISCIETRRGLRAGGDLAVEGTVKNNRGGGNNIVNYCIRITGEGVNVERSFMSFDELNPGETKDVTFVIPKKLLNGLSPDGLEIELSLLVNDIAE